MSTDTPIADRRPLRRRLQATRDAFVASVDHRKADAALAGHLADVLAQLAPERLGLYWSMRSEFNAAAACLGDEGLDALPLALPWVDREARRMTYRAWNRLPPTLVDECGIPAAVGPPVVPDVVLAPCLGFTADGFRLGYGGGYFDRWLAAHPEATAIGIAWGVTEIDRRDFQPEAHDLPMMMVVTERGVVSG
jgi:5,10-methenyltetrahydrofolate synthetase